MTAWRPLKRFCSSASEYGINISTDSYLTEGLRLVRTSDIAEDCTLAGEEEAVYVDPQLAHGLVLQDGDLLFSRSGTLGRCLRYTGPPSTCTFAAYLVRFRVLPEFDSRFIAYCAQARFFLAQITADAIQSTISNFNGEKYGNLRLPWHPADTQRAISDYLDAETARIDALIEKKQRMVELLEERKSLLFAEALESRGFHWASSLDYPAAHGAVPPEWSVAHLSVALDQLTNGYVGPTRDILVDDGVKYIQSLHIKDGKIDFTRGRYYVAATWHEERPRIHLRPGDVLIVQTGDIGQVAVVPHDFGQASCHALQIARVRHDWLSGEYLGAYLRSPFGRQSLLSRVTGALHPHLEGGIRDIPIVVPPLGVQRAVIEEISEKSAQVDLIRDRLADQIALAVEHRQAVITAAVAGQLEIATAAV